MILKIITIFVFIILILDTFREIMLTNYTPLAAFKSVWSRRLVNLSFHKTLREYNHFFDKKGNCYLIRESFSYYDDKEINLELFTKKKNLHIRYNFVEGKMFEKITIYEDLKQNSHRGIKMFNYVYDLKNSITMKNNIEKPINDLLFQYPQISYKRKEILEAIKKALQ